MATIDQRRPGSWRARVRLPGFALKTRTFDAQAESEVWAERVERELKNGHDNIPNLSAEPTLSEALARYGREITRYRKSQVQERRRIARWSRRALSALKLPKLNPQHFVKFRDECLHGGIKMRPAPVMRVTKDAGAWKSALQPPACW